MYFMKGSIMKLTYNLQKASLRFALDRLLKYIDKDPQANIVKLSQKIEPVFNKIFPPENFKKIQAVARDKDNIWTQFAINMVNDIDRNVLKQMLLSFGFLQIQQFLYRWHHRQERVHWQYPRILLHYSWMPMRSLDYLRKKAM